MKKSIELRPFYQSPDMFIKGRINFFDNSSALHGLCGNFLGYIEPEGKLFICAKANGTKTKFHSFESAKLHIVNSNLQFSIF